MARPMPELLDQLLNPEGVATQGSAIAGAADGEQLCSKLPDESYWRTTSGRFALASKRYVQ